MLQIIHNSFRLPVSGDLPIIYGKSEIPNYPLSTMKLFSASKANFAASSRLTESSKFHLINRISSSRALRRPERPLSAPEPGETKKRELCMKATKLFTLLVGSSLLLSGSAFAGNGNKKSLHIDSTVTVEGKPL